MADNPKKTAEEIEQMEPDDVEQSGGTFRSILKIFGIFLALAGIILAGFFAGIYLRVLDVYEMNEKLDLYAMPFIGEYFVEPMKKTPGVLDEYIFQPAKKMIDDKLSTPPPETPPPNGEQKPENGKADDKKGDKKDEKKDDKKQEQPKPEKKEEEAKPATLTKEEIEKKQKEAEAAERKRVSKLARVYNEMKPEAAADIMVDLDDEIAIAVLQKMDESQAAKVLAALDPSQSARLTRSIYSGKRSSMVSPGDQMEPMTPSAE